MDNCQESGPVREALEVATLKQARHFVAIILSIGPDMPARHRWSSLHDLAVQMNERLNAALKGPSQ